MKRGRIAEILQLPTYYLINKEDLASIRQKTCIVLVHFFT